MKVVIFAGGLGTRLSEETEVRPKPMVEICGPSFFFSTLLLPGLFVKRIDGINFKI